MTHIVKIKPNSVEIIGYSFFALFFVVALCLFPVLTLVFTAIVGGLNGAQWLKSNPKFETIFCWSVIGVFGLAVLFAVL